MRAPSPRFTLQDVLEKAVELAPERERNLVAAIKPLRTSARNSGGQPYQREVAERFVDSLDFRFVPDDEEGSGRTIIDIGAVRDGALGITTIVTHLRLTQPKDGKSYHELRRLLTLLTATMVEEAGRCPDVLRPDDLFFVGLVEVDSEEGELMAREQLYRLVTSLQATATLPSSFNLRFRFSRRMQIERAIAGAPGEALCRLGHSLLGHHLFALRKMLLATETSAHSHSTDGAAVSPLDIAVTDLQERRASGQLLAPERHPVRLAYLSELTVGLRAFERPEHPITLPCYPLTIVVGGNGSGKSSVTDTATLAVTGRVWERSRPWGPAERSNLSDVEPIRSLVASSQEAHSIVLSLVGVNTLKRWRKEDETAGLPGVLARVRALVQRQKRDGLRSDKPLVAMSAPRLANWVLNHDYLRLSASAAQGHLPQMLAVLLGDGMEQILHSGLCEKESTAAARRSLADETIRFLSADLSGATPGEVSFARAMDEIRQAVTAFGWVWDFYETIPSPNASWSLLASSPTDSRPEGHVKPAEQINTGDCSLLCVASFLLQNACSSAVSSGVALLDDPFADLDKYSARSLMGQIVRQRRYVGSAAPAFSATHATSVEAISVSCASKSGSRPQIHFESESTSGESEIDPRHGERAAFPAQVILTTADRDLALETLEAESFPATTRIRALLGELLPPICREKRLPWVLSSARRAMLALDDGDTPGWPEVRLAMSKIRAVGATILPEALSGLPTSLRSPRLETASAAQYILALHQALDRLRLHELRCQVEGWLDRPLKELADDLDKKSSKRARGTARSAETVACALCLWLESVDLLPAVLRVAPKLDAAGAALLPLPPPLVSGPALSRLTSERGEMLLRVDTLQERSLGGILDELSQRPTLRCCAQVRLGAGAQSPRIRG